MTAETNPEPNSPSKFLRQYGDELEALKDSLMQSMTLFRIIHSEETKRFREFAKNNGTEFSEDEKGFRVTIGSKYLTDFKRIEKRVNRVDFSFRLIPRNFLVALLCTYDAFLGKIFRYILTCKPEILNGSERSLTYADLVRFGDLEYAKEYIIEKEIESILRQSHVDHFTWLERKLNCSFRSGLEIWPQFVELTQRRNLFVHSDGVVSSQYLTVCRDHGCAIPSDVQVGSRLNVPQDYFEKSFECLYEIGIKLTQVVWRKLNPKEIKDAGTDLVDVTLNLIENRHYQVAIKVLSFFIQKEMKHDEESTKRIHVINLAQAYKWSGNDKQCISLLDSYDWSGWEDKFRLAIHVLKEEWSDAFSCMRRLVHNNEFDRQSYRSWPLFKQLRKHNQFPSVYKECYAEDFPRIESVAKTPELEAEFTEVGESGDNPSNN